MNDFGFNVGFRPGDTVFLEGYFTDAPLVLSLASSFGTAAQPLRITSWSNAAMATIAYPSWSGAYIYAGGAAPLGLGVQIDHLVFKGNGQADANGVAITGICVDFQPNSAASVDTLIIDNVDISGYMYGITTFRGAPAGFIRNVKITNSLIHDNVEYVDSSGGTYSYIARSGSGIFLSGVQNALIEGVKAFNNGGNNQQSPVGIGIKDSDLVLIRNCSCSSSGAGGFELSSGTTNSMIEDSFSSSNGGSGFSVTSQPDITLNGGGVCSNNTVKNSVSTSDGISSLYSLAVVAASGASASDILFQNMNVSITANDPPFQQFGDSSSLGFKGLYLSGTYNNVETMNVDFFFPSTEKLCNLICSSQTPSLCACVN